jgi:hypothetical protein
VGAGERHTHAHLHTDAYGDNAAEPDVGATDGDCDATGYAHADRDPADRDAVADTDAAADRDAHASTHPDTDAHADGDAGADGDAHAVANGHANAWVESNRDRDTNAAAAGRHRQLNRPGVYRPSV